MDDDSFPRTGRCRYASTQFSLQNEGVFDLKPVDKDMPIRTEIFNLHKTTGQAKHTKQQAAGINLILGDIIKEWPVDNDLIIKASLSAVNGYSFYHELFHPRLLRYRNIEINGNQVSTGNVGNKTVCNSNTSVFYLNNGYSSNMTSMVYGKECVIS